MAREDKQRDYAVRRTRLRRYMEDHSCVVGPFDGSFAQCVLDQLPGVANDLAAQYIAAACLRAYPEGLATAESGGVLFGYASGEACVRAKARATPSARAAAMIRAACYHRYPAR